MRYKYTEVGKRRILEDKTLLVSKIAMDGHGHAPGSAHIMDGRQKKMLGKLDRDNV